MATLAAAVPSRTMAAARTNVFTDLAGIVNDVVANDTNHFADVVGGHVGVMSLELEDDFDAVQIGVVNPLPTAWGVARLAVAASAGYGGDKAIGSAAHDIDGAPVEALVPVQWSHGGGNSAPPAAATTAAVTALASAANAAPGHRRLSFANPGVASPWSGAPPQIGWFVGDGLGCVPPGAVVTAVGPQSVSLSAAIVGPGCAKGQAIYFSPAPLGPFGQAVAPAASPGLIALTFSDWISLRSLPRTDGGFIAGAEVGGAGIAPGTTLSSVGYTSLGLSAKTLATIPARTAITLTYPRRLASAVAARSSQVTLADATGVRPGQAVTGAGLAPGTHVLDLRGTVVDLDRPTDAAVSLGATLGFVNTVWTTLGIGAGGSSLSVASTSGRPLLHVRYLLQPGAAPSLTKPQCRRDPNADTVPCEAPLGLPPIWSMSGGRTSAGLPINGIDFAPSLNRAARLPVGEPANPTFFVRFLGRHAGAPLLVCGGYQSSGANGSVSGEAPFGRIGAAWATAANPTAPVSVAVVAAARTSTTANFANCVTAIDALKPAVVLLQDYSNHNGLSPAAFRVPLKAVAEHAIAAGAQPVIYLAYVEGTALIGGLPVAKPVVSGTKIPLLTGINAYVAGSPTLMDGPGVVPGTTATSFPGEWYVTLSQPATIPAGAVLHFSNVVAAIAGRSIQLGYPSFAIVRKGLLSGPGVPPGTFIDIPNARSMSARVSVPVPLAPGAPLSIGQGSTSVIADYAGSAQWFRSTAEPWAVEQIDGLGALAANAGSPLMRDGSTTQGAYANDYGNSLVAELLAAELGKITAATRLAPAP